MASSRFRRWVSYSQGRRSVLLLPLVFAVTAIVVLSIGLLPVKSIAGLRCDAVLKGGEPKEDPAVMPPIRSRATKLCSDATNGRKLTMFGVGLFIVIAGVGAVLAPADRLEKYLTKAGDADEERYEEEARQAAFAREAEARQARDREARAVAEARREAQERATAERREARVASARAARLKARAEAASGPAKKAATKKAATKKAATKKAATKKAATKKAATKKVVTKPKKLVTKPAKAARTTNKLGAIDVAEVPTKASRPAKVASGSTSIRAGARKASVAKAGMPTAKVGTRTKRPRKAVAAVEPVPVEEPALAPETPVTEEVPAVDLASTAAPAASDAPAAPKVPEEVPAEAAPAPSVPTAVVKKVGTSRRTSRRTGASRPADREPVDGAPLL